VDDGVDAAMDRYAVVPPSSELVAQQAWIDECYDGETEAFFARSHVLGRELCR
jgi:enoyl-CoA hydratase